MIDWVSVTKNPPPEYEDVLVYVKMKDRQDDYYIVAYRNGKKFHQTPNLTIVGNVVYWMALPDSLHRNKK